MTNYQITLINNPKQEDVNYLRQQIEQDTINRTCSTANNFLLTIEQNESKIAQLYAKQYLNSYHIFLLHVTEENRRKGYGSILIKKIIAIAKENNINFITLNTVLNNSAKEFYLKLDFELEHERFGYNDNSTYCCFMKKT